MSAYNKKKALGRGLNALMGQSAAAAVQTGKTENHLIDIPLTDISPNPYQPRKTFDNLDELAASIQHKGVIEPIIVRKRKTGKYELISGERRFRASKRAGMTSIPAVVKEWSDLDSLEAAIIENIQRENFNAIEEALGYKMLMHEFKLTQEKVSRAVGKARSSVANRLRLLELPKKWQSDIAENKITPGHINAVLSVKNEIRRKALYASIIRKGLSVRNAEITAAAINTSDTGTAAQRNTTKRKKTHDPHVRDLAQTLTDSLGTSVIINGSLKKGTLMITYHSMKQLDTIIEKLRD